MKCSNIIALSPIHASVSYLSPASLPLKKEPQQKLSKIVFNRIKTGK